MEKKISYLNRTFDDYKQALIDFSKKYYPDMAVDYDDASVGGWLIDINAGVADNLGYYIDRAYQETNINSANERSSLYSLARNNGFKIPGPKGAMAEVEFSCNVPISSSSPNEPDYNYAPVVKRGTKVKGGDQIFELLDDVDFSLQFDEYGRSNRTIYPVMDSNGVVVQYKITKLAVVTAGESKIYKKVVYGNDVLPFMEIVIPEKNVMNVESIVVVDGTDVSSAPTYAAFYSPDENICSGSSGTTIERFFEVDYLAQQWRWDDVAENGKAVKTEYAYNDGENTYPVSVITKGEWKKAERKFITEYTDSGYLKVIFGSGKNPRNDTKNLLNDGNATPFAKFQIERIINNESLGYLPKDNSTIFVLYRVGGGKSSNLPAGAINYISFLNAEINGDNIAIANAVKRTLSVVSKTPSVSGKDMPTVDELRYMIKYNYGAQERCVTVKDYISRILMLPSKYGTPFRVGVNEANNKIMVSLLGIDYEGHLDSVLPVDLINNIRNYLTKYRMINDYVEIKSGKIINLRFDIDVFIDKNYNKSDVVNSIIDTVTDYMDINKHNMGDDIFIGDIEKEISKVDGVLNLINVDVWNLYGGDYSSTQISQAVIPTGTQGEALIDLEASDGIIYSDGEQMLEIKYPEKDIRIRVKVR